MPEKLIAVLDPTVKPRAKEVPIIPHFHDWNDKVIGFLWNSKPNGDLLLRRIQEQFSQRFRLAGTNWYEKPTAAVPAEATIIEELARTSDMVINAIGD